MAKYGSDDLSITVGGQEMKTHITEIGGFKVSALSEDGHTFGDTWTEKLFSGIKRGETFTISGFYDDTSTTGPDAVFNTIGTSPEFVITWGGSKTSTFNGHIDDYERRPVRGESTKYTVTVTPSGAVTEA